METAKALLNLVRDAAIALVIIFIILAIVYSMIGHIPGSEKALGGVLNFILILFLFLVVLGFLRTLSRGFRHGESTGAVSPVYLFSPRVEELKGF